MRGTCKLLVRHKPKEQLHLSLAQDFKVFLRDEQQYLKRELLIWC